MNVKKEKFLSLLSEAFFPLLFAVAGGLLISESCRLTAKYNPKVWLIGPSGFMTEESLSELAAIPWVAYWESC